MNAFSFSFCLICIFRPFASTIENKTRTITWTTENGDIEELVYESGLNNSDDGQQYESAVFLGIPYAEPPIGILRFAKPVPKSTWNNETLLCHEYKAACPQNISISEHSFQSEDCLYLNVFVSTRCLNGTRNITQDRDGCPILYWIHGGANEFETPSIYPVQTMVDNFASRDVILVSIAYRLGVLGFWSTGTQEAMGNWALEDILEGARWIQRQAKNFGGDPNRVTILGYSSSSALISLLTMSHKSSGLFHQAVLMSGTGEYGQLVNNDVTYYWRLANAVGCGFYLDSTRNTIECMRQVPSHVLINTFNAIRGYHGQFGLPPNLTMPRNDGPDGLLPSPLDQMMQYRRPLPTILGTTNNENGANKLTLLHATPKTVMEKCQSIVSESAYVRKREITLACIQEYVVRAEPPKQTSRFPFWTEQTVTLTEDFEYFSLCAREALSTSKTGAPVYLYSFDYEKTGLEGLSTWHAMDINYLANAYGMPWDARDYEIAKVYLDLLTNFVKSANPTPKPVDGIMWRSFRNQTDYSNLPYLSINLPVKMKLGYHSDGARFWNAKVADIEKYGSSSYALALKRAFHFGGDNQAVKYGAIRWIGFFYAFAALLIVLCTVYLLTMMANNMRFFGYERLD